MTLALRPYQQDMIDYILDHPRCALFSFMGSGKSVSVLTALDYLFFSGKETKPVLILAPLRVANSVWPEEVKKWEHLRHLKVSVITGTAQERLTALKMKADIYCMNYENIAWLIEKYGENWPFGYVVSDESTRLKSYRSQQGGKRTRALSQIANKCTGWINLTGTPAPQGLQDLWGQSWFLDQGQRLGKSFFAFQQRWFQTGYDGYSIQLLPHAQKQIEEKLSDICLSLSPKDHFDLREPISNILHVELPTKARKLYKNMEKEFFMQLGEHPVEAFNAASKSMKLIQICAGAAYVGEDAEKWEEIHDVKLQALDSIIEESAGAPVLVAYHFRSDLDRLRKYFPKGRVLDKSLGTISEWNSGKISLMFAHPASAGHGLNLAQGGNIIAFFSLNWNLEENLQIIERLGPVRQLQAGFDRNVFIHYIIVKNTIDELVMERLKTKKSVQDILLEALKKRI